MQNHFILVSVREAAKWWGYFPYLLVTRNCLPKLELSEERNNFCCFLQKLSTPGFLHWKIQRRCSGTREIWVFFSLLLLHIIVRSGFKAQCQVLSLFKRSRRVTQPLCLSRLLCEVSKRNSSSIAARSEEKLISSIPSISHGMGPASW